MHLAHSNTCWVDTVPGGDTNAFLSPKFNNGCQNVLEWVKFIFFAVSKQPAISLSEIFQIKKENVDIVNVIQFNTFEF